MNATGSALVLFQKCCLASAIEEGVMQGEQEKIFLSVSMGLLTLLAGGLLMMNTDPDIRAAGGPGVPAPGGPGWHLLDPVTYENLTIFPVVSTQQSDTSDFSTL